MDGFPSLRRPDPYLRMHCVEVFVRNQDRSLRFYLDQLGFHLAFDARLQTGERWVAVAPPDGTAILALVSPKPNTPQYKMIGRSTHAVFITEDVTAKYLEWSKRGVRFSHTPRLKRIKYDRAGAGVVVGHGRCPPSGRGATAGEVRGCLASDGDACVSGSHRPVGPARAPFGSHCPVGGCERARRD